MLLILCHPADGAALWLHATLARLGAPVEIVSVEQMVYSRRIVHRLDCGGDDGAIELADGRKLSALSIAMLVNRVQALPQRHFERVAAADRAYALEELSAFLLAWLDAVRGRVINPARPHSLGGDFLHPATMTHLAASAGLPAAPWRADSWEGMAGPADQPVSHAVIVFDGRVFGPVLPRVVQEGCRRLATLTGMPLLQVDFTLAPLGNLRFAAAHGLADFRLGGRSLAAALAAAHAVAAAAA